MIDDKPRIRISTKQTAKGLWTIEGTAELNGTEINLPIDQKDMANIQVLRAGDLLLREIKHTEELFREDGRRLAGDVKEMHPEPTLDSKNEGIK